MFQRTPQWVLPKPAPHFGPLARTALRLPGAHRLYRQGLHRGADAVLAPIMRRGWSARPAELLARWHLHRQIHDPVLRAKLTPDYPIGGKRIILDNHYYPTLTRPTVDLITAPITRLTTNGLETLDGVRHRADAVIYATGFRAPEFLVPVTVRGRNGMLLHECWSSGASAFLGVAVPGFPNAFLIGGPNTFNPAGSNPVMKEHQIDYIIRCLRWREQIGAEGIEIDATAMRRYQRWLDHVIDHTVWPLAGPSWYKHRSGRVTNPWPASARAFEQFTRRAPEDAFTTVPMEACRERRSAHSVSTRAAS
jgi:cation diffusion facilitator CzcD-associated flavoprotein CzcO